MPISSAQSESGSSSTNQTTIKNPHPLGPVSPSPPLTSPDTAANPPPHFQQPHELPHEPHRPGVSSSVPPKLRASVDDGTQPGPHPPQQSPYLSSPAYSTSHTNTHTPLQLSSLLDPSSNSQHAIKRDHDSPPPIPAVSTSTRGANDAEMVPSDGSIGYPSPANGSLPHHQQAPSLHHRASFSGPKLSRQHQDRGSFNTTIAPDGSLPDLQPVQNSLYKAPSSDCRYRCLDPVLPYLRDIIPASVACDLLDVYGTEPGSSLFRCASPYILTRIFRKKSLLHPTNPRRTTPALLATMLWCSAQTADIVLLHVPGSRAKICNALYDLATSLISDRDPDRWRRIHGIPPDSLAQKPHV